jgi:hypothetical protein
MLFSTVNSQRVIVKDRERHCLLIALIVRRERVIFCKAGADSGYGEYAGVRESEGADCGGLDGVTKFFRGLSPRGFDGLFTGVKTPVSLRLAFFRSLSSLVVEVCGLPPFPQKDAERMGHPALLQHP